MYGFVGLCMAVYGYLWQCIVMYAYVGLSVVICGYVWPFRVM